MQHLHVSEKIMEILVTKQKSQKVEKSKKSTEGIFENVSHPKSSKPKTLLTKNVYHIVKREQPKN